MASNSTHRGPMIGAVMLLIFGVLVYSGLLKLQDPRPAARFLEQVVGASSVSVVTVVATVEIGIAIWLVSGRATALAGLSAAGLFTSFAVMHLAAWTLGVKSECGCLGRSALLDQLPHWGWTALNAGMATLALWGIRKALLRSPHAALADIGVPPKEAST